MRDSTVKASRKDKRAKKASHVCSYEYEITRNSEDLKEIRDDVKSLLKLKWALMGMGSLIAAIAGSIINILLRH